jgi:hypothetical protein
MDIGMNSPQRNTGLWTNISVVPFWKDKYELKESK